MATVAPTDVLAYLEVLGPEDMLKWAYETYGDRAAIQTSFQNTGCVQGEMASRVAPKLRIFTIDTLSLPHETYQILEDIEKK